MGQAAQLTRENHTITVDFHDETTDVGLLGNSHAFVEFVLAFILALGFQLLHKASCSAGVVSPPVCATGLSLLRDRGGLVGAAPRGQPWTPAVTLPQGRNGLSARRMAVL